MGEIGEFETTTQNNVLWPQQMNRKELEGFGRVFDHRPASLDGATVAMALAEKLLRVRTREGTSAPLKANEAQRGLRATAGRAEYCAEGAADGDDDVGGGAVLSEDDYAAGNADAGGGALRRRRPKRSSALCTGLWIGCRRNCARGRCKTSRANVRQMAFPEMDSQYRVVSAGDRNAGRGLTVQNLHCSELARWPGDPAETLAGLRAAMAPGAELILESTPDGVGGCFHEEWRKAGETGMVRHFFPWWMEPRYRAAGRGRRQA